MMTKEQRFLLQILSLALFSREAAPPEDMDWRAFLRESMAQSVLPLALSAAKPWIPPEIYDEFKVLEARTIAGSMRLEREHAQLHDCMSGAGISYAVIKGSASAAYYPEPLLRTMGDVDFFVNRSDLESAGEALKSIGLAPEGKPGRYHVAYQRAGVGGRKVDWEMHWEPNGIPDGPRGDQIRRELEHLVGQARLHEGQFGPYMVPAPFHHGLVILLHIANHMINSGVGLRHLCDWAVFTGSMDEAELRRMFECFSRETGLWSFLLILTALCARYLGSGHEWTLEPVDGELLERLMEDVFNSGNFGVKDAQRINQAKFLTTKGSATVDNAGMLRQLFRTMNEKARIRLPACRENPLLLPLGWILAAKAYLRRVRRKKRPALRMGETVQGARTRKQIYRQFRLFEEDRGD